MPIHEATEPSVIRRCFPVMVQLRPALDEDGFVEQVQRQAKEGYRLAYLKDGGNVVAVAGFRVLEMLSRGRFLYVDDLVTDQAARSQGHGGALLAWLLEVAQAEDCQQLDLDSGVQRHAAHRFYFREGMHVPSFHFALGLGDDER